MPDGVGMESVRGLNVVALSEKESAFPLSDKLGVTKHFSVVAIPGEK